MKIITIGASAGGVESLKRLCRALDPDINAAFFIVMHLPSDSGSMLAEILDRVGTLRAVRAEHGAPIERGRIYVGQPNHHLLVDDAYLRLDPGPRENGFRPARSIRSSDRRRARTGAM
jgi:two-component system chemotaxis response regulator CheB